MAQVSNGEGTAVADLVVSPSVAVLEVVVAGRQGMLIDGAAPTAGQRWTEWVELVSKIAILIGGLVAGFWAYIRFVLEKGLLPPVEFDVACTSAGVLRDRRVVELVLQLKNVGSSTLICHNLRLDVMYLLENCDERNCAVPRLESNPGKPLFGHLLFHHSLAKDLQLKNAITPPAKPHMRPRPWLQKVSSYVVLAGRVISRTGRWIASLIYEPLPATPARPERGFLVLPWDTFVQPAVSQAYPFVTTLPGNTTHVLVWASFRYGVRPQLLQRAILRVGRVFGLIQYSLTHVNRAHSIERVFDLRQQAEERRA